MGDLDTYQIAFGPLVRILPLQACIGESARSRVPSWGRCWERSTPGSRPRDIGDWPCHRGTAHRGAARNSCVEPAYDQTEIATLSVPDRGLRCRSQSRRLWTSRVATSLPLYVPAEIRGRRSTLSVRSDERGCRPKSGTRSGRPTPDADVWLAAAWRSEHLQDCRPAGVYTGLDTLSERNGNGSNLEIGWTRKADPAVLSMDWAYKSEGGGGRHLIEGIYNARRTCQRFGLSHPGSLPADYVFFFGYSGVVIAAALERIAVDWDCLFLWGFHDGGLCYLARSSPGGITRIAVGPNEAWPVAAGGGPTARVARPSVPSIIGYGRVVPAFALAS